MKYRNSKHERKEKICLCEKHRVRVMLMGIGAFSPVLTPLIIHVGRGVSSDLDRRFALC